jgi:hypothetical protein
MRDGHWKKSTKESGAIVSLLGNIKAHERIEIPISFQVSDIRYTLFKKF